jgi:hypothetical protein
MDMSSKHVHIYPETEFISGIEVHNKLKPGIKRLNFTALAVKNPFLTIKEDHYPIIYCHSSKYLANNCCFKCN